MSRTLLLFPVLFSRCLLTVFMLTASLNAQQPDVPSDPARIRRLFDEHWQRVLRESPGYASQLGDRRYARQWPDLSLPAINESLKKNQQLLATVRSLRLKSENDADRLNLRLLESQLQQTVEEQEHRLFLLPINQREGIQDQHTLADLISFDSTRDYDDWIARMRAVPRLVGQTMALMKQGMREKILHPKVVMERIPAQLRRQIVTRPEESLYFKPFLNFQAEVSPEDQKRLRREASRAVEECILPSYRTFLDFFEKEYLPASFDEIGCWKRANGDATYAALVRHFTTTSMSPQEVHDLGLREVARIRAQMESLQKEIGFEGSFQEFLTHLRSDLKYYFRTEQELLEAYRECCRRIDPELPRLFRRLPKLPYEILPVPAQMAADTTTAYYQPPSPDGRRPGGYYVNLHRPEVRPKYEIEALSLHESVPGHHLQIAIAMELTDLPEFRRYGGPTAYVEGWGLYSEKLGEELGLYQDPISHFGQLTYEMWRAVRLVVDTGIHSLHWDRQRAIEYFASQTAKSMLDIQNEVDRYIAWPGQALAYKVGELKIRDLRHRAETSLGKQFDIREFHDVILARGAVPLDVLEEIVDDWIRKTLNP
ncbi:MAG: DUF885 domain-containing protein [Planctomyces sp.]